MSILQIDTDYLIDDQLQKNIFLYISANKFLSLLSQHKRTDSTIDTYASVLRVLIRCISQLKGSDIRLEELTEEDIYSMIDIMNGKESTIKARINVLGQWIEFETGKNITKQMKLLWNSEEPRRRFIDKDEYQRILSLAANDTERLIIGFGSQMGMRMNEIVNIRLDDIRGDYLIIYGKGHGKGKVVEKQIPDGLMKLIDGYLYGERMKLLEGKDPTDRLLLQNTRNHPSGIPITDNTVIQLYKRLSSA